MLHWKENTWILCKLENTTLTFDVWKPYFISHVCIFQPNIPFFNKSGQAVVFSYLYMLKPKFYFAKILLKSQYAGLGLNR
jgi:hypothetical protein